MMSTEKIIKNQAKVSLKGNWTLLIVSIMFALIIVIAVQQLASLILVILGAVELESGDIKEDMQLLSYGVLGILYAIAFFLTPIVNGIIRMFCNISKGKSIEISDMFYFFKGVKRYFKTIFLNFILTFIYFSISSLFDLYNLISISTGRSINDGHSFDFLSTSLILAYLFSIIAKVLVYFIFIHYPLIGYSFYDNISIRKCIFELWGFSLNILGTTINLFLSFAGWILLCFFVVPAIYVLPYIITSFTTSAKWLLPEEEIKEVLC